MLSDSLPHGYAVCPFVTLVCVSVHFENTRTTKLRIPFHTVELLECQRNPKSFPLCTSLVRTPGARGRALLFFLLPSNYGRTKGFGGTDDGRHVGFLFDSIKKTSSFVPVTYHVFADTSTKTQHHVIRSLRYFCVTNETSRGA